MTIVHWHAGGLFTGTPEDRPLYPPGPFALRVLMSVGLSPKHCWAITEMRRKPIGLNSEVNQEERVVLIGLVADSIPTVPSEPDSHRQTRIARLTQAQSAGPIVWPPGDRRA